MKLEILRQNPKFLVNVVHQAVLPKIFNNTSTGEVTLLKSLSITHLEIPT